VRRRGVGGCSATRARRRRRRAHSNDHRGGGSVILLHCNAIPFIVGTARLVAFPDHIAYVVRPPMVRKPPETRLDGWFRRTKGGGRPSQVLCGPNLAESINQLKRPTRPPYSRDCAGRDARYLRIEQAPFDSTPANRIWRGVGNSSEKQMLKIWAVSVSWIVYVARSTLYRPQTFRILLFRIVPYSM